MMAKTTLSDGRRTRPRFAASAPTPPKFLIGTDDPARIGILPVLRREGSDQRESKGFGWDPAKTLRMAQPPEFLIGTIDQSENHSTPEKQTTYPNPNGHKTRFSIRRSASHFPHRATLASVMSRRFPSLVPLAQPHPRKLSRLRQSLGPTPLAQLHPRNLDSPQRTRLPHPPQRIAVLVMSRPPSSLLPLAQPYPRKKTSGRGFASSPP